MKECKQCKKPLKIALPGLKDFCSPECKKAHRMAYQASWLKKKRNVDSRTDTNVSIAKMSTVETLDNSHSTDGKNGGLRLSEDNFSIKTIKEGEDIAEKYCPEYSRKKREGYCIRESLPHEIECVWCINEQIRLKTGQIFEALFGEIKGL